MAVVIIPKIARPPQTRPIDPATPTFKPPVRSASSCLVMKSKRLAKYQSRKSRTAVRLSMSPVAQPSTARVSISSGKRDSSE
jgi:hypothetical protein